MEIKLQAQTRENLEKMSADWVPAVLYGKGVTSQSLKIKKSDFDKVFKTAGESNLIDLEYGQAPVKVLIKEVQHDVLKGYPIHVDFYQVNMKEKITTEIPLHFIGESKAIKELGGTLIKDLDALSVQCLPADLVDHIDVDISVLNTFDDGIRVNDLKLPTGLELVHHTNEMVAAVKEPKAEEEPAPVEGEAAAGAATAAGTPEAAGETKEPEKK